jgi:hypothetical protein
VFRTEYEEEDATGRRNRTMEEEWDKENEKHRDDVLLI